VCTTMEDSHLRYTAIGLHAVRGDAMPQKPLKDHYGRRMVAQLERYACRSNLDQLVALVVLEAKRKN